MVTTTQLAVFLPAAVLLALSPGANNFLAMQHGMRFGVREATIALIGRLIAFVVMLFLAVASLATVLIQSQVVFEFIKWVGVAYLAYLGVRSLLARPRTGEDPTGAARQAGRVGRARREFLTVAANPKALLLFTAFLPQFVDPAEPVASQLLLLGPLYIACELVAATGWASIGHRLRLADLSAGARRRLDRAFGVAYLALAGALATAKR